MPDTQALQQILCCARRAELQISGTPWILTVEEPPSAYVHHYRGHVIERVLPLAEARRLCAGMGAPADACAWTAKGVCHIVIPRNGPVPDLKAYRRHELAHCNGWDHAHGLAEVFRSFEAK